MRITIATVIIMCLAEWALAQKIVVPGGCEGPEVKKSEVLLIDLSESPDRETALAGALEKYKLKVVRQLTIETEAAFSMKGAFRKAAKRAGKDRCDAVIVLRKGVAREQETALIAGPSGVSGYSAPDSDEWVEVLFADEKGQE